jgi:regulator of protease activity HflC (stomatin/prohibitin superfamily)
LKGKIDMPSMSCDVLVKIMIAVALVSFFLAIAFIRFAVKTIPENKRVVIFRLGKSLGSRGPGIVILIPIIDSAIWVDLQRTYHFKYSNLPISNSQRISCAITLEGKVIDPEKSVLNVPNLENALSKRIETEIMDIARSKRRDELINLGGWVEGQLKEALYRSSGSWGFEVTQLILDDIQQTQA